MSEELYSLPKGWKWTTTGQVCSSVRDGTHDTPKYVADGIPLITSKNLKETGLDFSTALNISIEDHRKISVRSVVENGDVLFAMIGTIGNPVIVRTEKAFSIKNIGLFKKDESVIDSNYLKFWLSSWVFNKIFEERQLLKGTTQKFVPLGHLRVLPLPLAPLAEQKRIVEALEQHFSRLDVGVVALRQVQAKLKRYRAAVLKAAVEGKLTEAWRDAHPTTEPATILLERILKERRAKWEADLMAKGKDPAKVKYVEPAKIDMEGLPELPEGWCWATVEQVSSLVRYGTSAKTTEDASGIPVLRMGNIQEDSLNLGNLKYLPANHPEFPNLLLERGDLLFNRTNSAELVGKSAVYHGNPVPCSYASYLISVRMVKGCLSGYLCCFLNSLHGKAWVASVVSQQVGQANVNGTKLQALTFPVPPVAEQEQIVAEVDQRLSIVAQLEAIVEANLKRAERLRQSILKEAFAGRLVPQDPDDEPASVLLERIRKEREGQKKGNNGNGRFVRVSDEPVQIDVEGTRQVELWEGVGGGE